MRHLRLRRFVRQDEHRPVMFGLMQKKNILSEAIDLNEDTVLVFGLGFIAWFFGTIILL